MSRLDGSCPCRLLAPLAVLSLLLGPGAGCGRRDPGTPSMTGDAAGISDLIDDWNERGPEPDLFVEGNVPGPGQLASYRRYSFYLTGTPRVSGSPATVPVTVYDEDAGEEVGKVDWTFAKVGEDWKVESAPLP